MWPFRTARTPAAPAAPRSHGTLAFAGAPRPARLRLDDYNPDLRGPAALRVYDRMRRSDGQVRAIHTLLGLPLRATPWHVEPPPQPSPAEDEAARLLHADLFGGMRGSFDDLLRDFVRALYFGFTVAEIEWGEAHGRTVLLEIHPRNLELIDDWLYDARGRLVGLLFAGSRLVGEGLRDAPARLRPERVPVPLHRLIHAPYEAENGSPSGFALARSLYPHWYLKQAIYNLCGIGLERNWLGVPVARADPAASWSDVEEVLAILSRLRATEDGAVALRAGWHLDWFEPHRSPTDVLPLLNHLDSLMARAALAQFLLLGQFDTGTQALAQEHVRVFMEGQDAVARWIAQVLDRQLVRRWVRLNYGPALRPPRLRHRPIRNQSLEATARALDLLVRGGFVTPAPADEAHLRALAELPDPPEPHRRRATPR